MELTTKGVTLHYLDDGNPDAPPILMLHGITQSVATWDWLVPELVDDYRVVRLDFRGHGQSDRTPGAYNFSDYVGDAVAVCEQVLGRPAVVVGHSLGGGTAAGLAQTRPDLVRGVVLEDPAIMLPTISTSGLENNPLFQAFDLMRTSIPMLQESGMTAGELANGLTALPSPAGPLFGEITHDDAIVAMAEGMLNVDVAVLELIFDGLAEPVFLAHKELPVPGAILAGDRTVPGTIVRPRDLELLKQHSPHIDQRVVTGAGHMIHDSKDHRDIVRSAIVDVLSHLSSE